MQQVLACMYGPHRHVTFDFLSHPFSCRRPRGMMESLSGWVFGQRLDSHTPSELQAELFYAEANLLLSFITFLQVNDVPTYLPAHTLHVYLLCYDCGIILFQDESLMSFVKGGLRIRSCYSSYKYVKNI